jgi:predicted cobalt transporter CbtA
VCYPALPCKLAAVVIHRMLWWKKGVLSLRCQLAAVVIHRMLWCKKVLSLRCHASKLLS